jgi:hypothetical protein
MPRCFPTLLLLASTLVGCAFVAPRFPQNIQTSFAREEMRKLTTTSLEVYYPAQLRPEALRIAARVEDCVERLRDLTKDSRKRKRVLVYLTSADFNNAYVMPEFSSIPQQMVMPTRMSLELFNLMGFGLAELGEIGCHEAVHYVQMQQTSGLWHAVNTVTGGLFQPNVFTESWFLEGLATYYEGHLGRAQGRPHSPMWRGYFEAAARAHQGRLHPGHLSPEHRELLPVGGNYLTGSYFVQWLARTYGEDKLWRLVELQGDSIVSSLGVTLRFERIYGRTIGTLFDQFTRSLVGEVEQRQRPETQRVLVPEVGYFARLTASPADGAIATVSARRDEVVRLDVHESNGTLRFSRRITRIIPPRPWIATNPTVMSGLSFTEDGRWLFLVAADIDPLGSYLARVWQVDARTGDVVRTWEGIDGMGGSVTPDAQAYVYVRVQGDTSNLYRLELSSGAHTPLTAFEGRTSLGPPAVSPDGRIAFSMMTEAGWNLVLREPDGSLRPLTDDARSNYAPRWLDARHLLFQREHQGRWQAHMLDLANGEVVRLTDAPHLVMDVAPLDKDTLVFLNREAFDFSLDTAPLRPVATRESVEPVEPPPATASMRQPQPPFVPRELDLLSDEPYSPLEGILSPVLHSPFAYALPRTDRGFTVYGGLALAGQDRLGFHQYALLAQMDSTTRTPNLAFSYGNALLAPWYLRLSASRTTLLDRRDMQASASLSRTVWVTPISLGLLALDRKWLPEPGRTTTRTSLLGAQVSTSYFAGEGTPYGGTQRGLGLSLATGAYPFAFASPTRTVGDVRAGVDTFLPGLPLLSRDNLQLSLVGRFLPGAPLGLLQVGGIPLGSPFFQQRQGPTSDFGLPLQLQPGAAFTEYLRGYEDHALGARHAVIASARYRYRFIIDRGWSSFFWLGPSFFISQVDLEAFGSWARTDFRANHRAAGGALFLRTTFGQAMPFSLYYQFAARFDDGLGPLHTAGFAL